MMPSRERKDNMPSWITSRLLRILWLGTSALALTISIGLGYLLGVAQGFEAGEVQGRTLSISQLELAREAGYQEGAQVSGSGYFYLGVYATCLDVMREMYQMAHDTSIAFCKRGLSWSYREQFFEKHLTEEFWWPVRALESQQEIK